MSNIELTSKVRELKELEHLIEEATTEAEAVKDTIKAEMTARGAEEMTVDVYKIRWAIVNSNRFDTTAFKATHKDLYEQYTKASTTRRFSVA